MILVKTLINSQHLSLLLGEHLLLAILRVLPLLLVDGLVLGHLCASHSSSRATHHTADTTAAADQQGEQNLGDKTLLGVFKYYVSNRSTGGTESGRQDID